MAIPYDKRKDYYEVDTVRTKDGGGRCQWCQAQTKLKYIATGHDHTDYSYPMCNCAGAKANGKPYEELE